MGYERMIEEFKAASSDVSHALVLTLPVGAVVDGMRHLGGGRFEIPLAKGMRQLHALEGVVCADLAGTNAQIGVVDMEFQKREDGFRRRAVWDLRIMEGGRYIGGYGDATCSDEFQRQMASANGVSLVDAGEWNDAAVKPTESGVVELQVSETKTVKALWSAAAASYVTVFGDLDGFNPSQAKWRTPAYWVSGQ